MSNYKSKHTGAQVDEAVSKVLNGEVGGGATPDWNAKEGEAGYIENRPFERKNIEPFMYDNEVVYEDFGDIDIYIQCYDSIYSFPFGYNDDDGLFIESEKEIYIPEDSVSIKVRRCEYEMRIQSLNSELDVNDIPSLITVFYVDRKLNQSDIDNTVLKTTPQELSDADKNQALSNLGILPVMVIEETSDFTVPKHIIPLIFDERNNRLNEHMVKKLFVTCMYDGYRNSSESELRELPITSDIISVGYDESENMNTICSNHGTWYYHDGYFQWI